MTPGPITPQTLPPENRQAPRCEIRTSSKANPRDREVFPILFEDREKAYADEIARVTKLSETDPNFEPTVIQLMNEWGGVEKTKEIPSNE